jgi:hypothetical protein
VWPLCRNPWAANGLTDVVSLLEDHEVRELELTREAELVRQASLDFERLPIPDRGIPTSLELAHELWHRLEAKLRNEHSVGIHCRASIGRAGLVAVGTLPRLGVVEEVAWQRASIARQLLRASPRNGVTSAYGPPPAAPQIQVPAVPKAAVVALTP